MTVLPAPSATSGTSSSRGAVVRWPTARPGPAATRSRRGPRRRTGSGTRSRSARTRSARRSRYRRERFRGAAAGAEHGVRHLAVQRQVATSPNVPSCVNIGVPSGRTAAAGTSARLVDPVGPGRPGGAVGRRLPAAHALLREAGRRRRRVELDGAGGQLHERGLPDGEQPRGDGEVAGRARPDLERPLPSL